MKLLHHTSSQEKTLKYKCTKESTEERTNINFEKVIKRGGIIKSSKTHPVHPPSNKLVPSPRNPEVISTMERPGHAFVHENKIWKQFSDLDEPNQRLSRYNKSAWLTKPAALIPS